MILGLILGALLGIFIGLGLQSAADEDCPRRVLHYECRGDKCDHRKSLLYENMASMALNEEQNKGNYRGGV